MKYPVITLCGSTKFKEEFIKKNEELTLDGNVVISVALFGHADNRYDNTITKDIKERLDDIHFQKIEMADTIYVIDKDEYIGSSTAREIAYAKTLKKPIRYFSEEEQLKILLERYLYEMKTLNMRKEMLYHINQITKFPYKDVSSDELIDQGLFMFEGEDPISGKTFRISNSINNWDIY